MLLFVACAVLVASQTPSVPTIGGDWQAVIEVHVPSDNVSLAINYVHSSSLNFSRIEFQDNSQTWIHIANVFESERFDVHSNDSDSTWLCEQLWMNSTRALGAKGLLPPPPPGSPMTVEDDDTGDEGMLETFFYGTGATFSDVFLFGGALSETYDGEKSARGTLSDCWTHVFTTLHGLQGNVSRTFCFSAASTRVNGADAGRVPVRASYRGTLNGEAFWMQVDFVHFLPFNPPAWTRSYLFGDCHDLNNVANAASFGGDDDHEELPVPPLPPLPGSHKFVIEVNEFTHNTSYVLKFYRFARQSRVEYHSLGSAYVDIADVPAAKRYEFVDPLNCTSVALNSTMPFGGEPVAPPEPPGPWSGVEDDDDDLIEALFYALGVNGSSLYDIFVGANQTMDMFMPNVNVRGVRCDCWQKHLTAMPIPYWHNVAANLTLDVFITSPGVESSGDHLLRAPMRFALAGTISGFPFSHQYEIVAFEPYTPTPRDALAQFGSCSVQANLARANGQPSAPPTPVSTTPIATPTATPAVSAGGVSVGALIGVAVIALLVGAALGAGLVYWRYRGVPIGAVRLNS